MGPTKSDSLNVIFVRITQYLTGPLLSQFRIIFLWMLICFIQTGLFALSFENFSFSRFLNFSSLLTLLAFFLFFIELSFIIANISAFAFWISAKCLKGRGTYSKTCVAFLWVMVYFTLPFGFSTVLIKFNWPMAFIIKKIFLIGKIASLIFGFLAMVKSLSSVHNFSLIRGFFALILGCSILFPVGLFAKYLIIASGDFDSFLRTLFVVLIPISVQLLVTFIFIFIACKMMGKWNRQSSEPPKKNQAKNWSKGK